MSDMLGQNVEIVSDVDSMGKVESSSRKLKFHDITYEKVNGAFKKRLAERNIKSEIKEEVRDFTEEGGQEHLDKISILMSQYKFINSGVKESPELVARRAIRLNDQMIFNAKLNSKLINAMLEKEKVDNVSTINESEEEQLVNAINQISENEVESAAPEKTEEVAPVMPSEEDFAPLFNNTVENPEENVSNVDDIESSLDDFDKDLKETGASLDELEKDIKNLSDRMNATGEVEEEVSEKGVLPMTDEEIEASRQLLKESEPSTDHKKFTFEDIFGTDEKEEESVVVPEENVMSSEDAFMEVDKLLQQADVLRSRGNKAMEEREKAEQRRKAAEDRKRQAADDEAMKKAALAKAIAEYKQYVAQLEETETETLKATEDANAAADKEDEDKKNED